MSLGFVAETNIFSHEKKCSFEIIFILQHLTLLPGQPHRTNNAVIEVNMTHY